MEEREQRGFTDQQAEDILGLSVSRLRTAQRFGLVEASVKRSGQRHVRFWQPDSLACVYLAAEIDKYLSVPFPVACQIIKAFRKEEREAVRKSWLSPPDPGLVPTVEVMNREVIIFWSTLGLACAGFLCKGDDHRFSFTPCEDGQNYERIPAPMGRCEFNSALAMSEFCSKYGSALQGSA